MYAETLGSASSPLETRSAGDSSSGGAKAPLWPETLQRSDDCYQGAMGRK